MKQFLRCALAALTAAGMMVSSAGAESAVLINEHLEPATREEIQEMVASVTEEYFQDSALAKELNDGLALQQIRDPFGEGTDEVMNIGTLTYEGNTMWIMMGQIGEPGKNGLYPLYITLHGGGEDPESTGNDQQWGEMYSYYKDSVDSGIYVACRGITDTWDLHFRPESYPMYDRLIQTMVYLYQADPNRVYLLGFSAGGDGVYQITARMADRFAAANMSSGHPNGVLLKNLANCAFSIQVGIVDYYSEDARRSVRGAEFDRVLNRYHDELGTGYIHQVLVHVPAGHNYNDYGDSFQDGGEGEEVLANPSAFADPALVEPMMERFLDAYEEATGIYSISEMSYWVPSESTEFAEAVRKIVKEEYRLETIRVNANAVDFVSGYTRNPAPENVVWDLGTRAPSRKTTCFYWLKADASVTEGTITARLTGDNTLTVTPKGVNGDFSILVNPALLDVSRPIRIITPEGEREVQVNPSREILADSMRETGDPSLAWAAEIPWSMLHP